jgi:dihydroorotate dehydrogenase (NAD+) catalytic subunit
VSGIAVPATAVSSQLSLSLGQGKVRLNSPILASSGCAGYGRELGDFEPVAHYGAIITKSIMWHPRAGRPTPRMVESVGGMLNSIGLQGCGIEEFLAEHLPWLAAHGARIGVSIAGESPADYQRVAVRVAASGLADFLELNISCPNVDHEGAFFASEPAAAAEVVAAVHHEVGDALPIFAKLAADVSDVVAVARACADAGAGGLSLINTLTAMTVNRKTLLPALPGVTGGYSGPAIRPIALRAVWQVHRAMPEVPLIGGGGVLTGADALDLVVAGASAVSVGTAIFRDPRAPITIAAELQSLLHSHGFARVADAVGWAHREENQHD